MFRLSTICFAIILAACSDTSTHDLSPQVASEARTFVFYCQDQQSFVARIDSGSVWLFLPKETLRLSTIVAASGAKFSDGVSTFWSKGGAASQEAMLEYGGQRYTGCKNDARAAVWEHAKLNGVDFRAVGNEPGWYLEISNRHDIILVSDYGESRYEFNDVSISTFPEEHKTVYSAVTDVGPVDVTLVAEACQDTMVDVQYETRVTVTMSGTVLNGCGKALH